MATAAAQHHLPPSVNLNGDAAIQPCLGEPTMREGKSTCGPVLTKSKSGCLTCKIRRVKCDEIRPTCGPCARRFTAKPTCNYDTNAPRRKLHNQRLVASQDSIRGYSSLSPGLTPRPPSVSDSSLGRRALELKLMYHYTTVVAGTMPLCHGALSRDMWQRTIPQFAFESEVVLSPMLALAALHIHVENQSDETTALAFTMYLDRSLTAQREAIQLLDAAVGEQVWLAAKMLSNMYWLYAHYRPPGEGYRLPFSAWDMILNVQRLFTHKHVSLKRLGYEWSGLGPSPSVPAASNLSVEAATAYRGLEADLSRVFTGFGVHYLPRETQAAYEAARDEVLANYRCFFGGHPATLLRQRIGLAGPKCGATYRSLMALHDPLAMALFARSVCLLKGIDPRWWMNGKGRYEVLEATVRGVQGLMPESARWCMNWPDRVLRGEIELQRKIEAIDDADW